MPLNALDRVRMSERYRTRGKNLPEIEVTLLKSCTVPDWHGSRACDSRCDPPTPQSVTVLTIGADAPGHMGSALTAHHTAWNKAHILKELDAEVGVAEQECEKQLVSYAIGTQRRRRNVRLGIEVPLVCFNNRNNANIRSVRIVEVREKIFPLLNLHSMNESDTGVRRKMTKCSAKPGGEEGNAMNISND